MFSPLIHSGMNYAKRKAIPRLFEPIRSRNQSAFQGVPSCQKCGLNSHCAELIDVTFYCRECAESERNAKPEKPKCKPCKTCGQIVESWIYSECGACMAKWYEGEESCSLEQANESTGRKTVSAVGQISSTTQITTIPNSGISPPEFKGSFVF